MILLASGLVIQYYFAQNFNDSMFIADFFHKQKKWVNPYTVVAMDTGERIHLISAKTDAEVEVNTT